MITVPMHLNAEELKFLQSIAPFVSILVVSPPEKNGVTTIEIGRDVLYELKRLLCYRTISISNFQTRLDAEGKVYNADQRLRIQEEK